MPTYVLAVDGGGTKTAVLCADSSGRVVGQGASGPTNLTTTTVGAASFNLREAVRQAVENIPEQDRTFACLAMGLAGMDTPAEQEVADRVFHDVLSPLGIAHFILVNDSVIALANGSDAANALVVIAGTGSIAYGKNQENSEAKAGGMDFLLTDQGSGYYIGWRVLQEAVKSFDGRGPKTILEKLLVHHYHISSMADLKKVVYNPLLSKIEVAELAQLCSQAVAEHDEVAQKIFGDAVAELTILAQTVARRLHLASFGSFECVLAGSVLHLPSVHEPFTAALKQEFPSIIFSRPDMPPVYGALKIALRHIRT